MGVVLRVAAVVKQHFQPLPRAHLEVVATFRTTEKVRFQILLPEDVLAGFALGPQALGLHALLLGRSERMIIFAKPGHGN